MDNSIELNKHKWQEFVYWYEETYHWCDWQPVTFGFCIVDTITGEIIATQTSIPEQYFVNSKFYNLSPWVTKNK